MSGVVFWDVDTQVDFMDPHGALYVKGSEDIRENLRLLTDHARRTGTRIVASVDFHAAADEELSPSPDFLVTFPPHCLRGTPGQEKVAETAPTNPLWIDSAPMEPHEVAAHALAHPGEIVF